MKYARERAITFRHVPGKKEASPRGAERAGDSATPVCTKHCKRNDLLCHVTNRFEIFSQITALTRGGPPCFKLSRFSRNAARRHACDISSRGRRRCHQSGARVRFSQSKQRRRGPGEQSRGRRVGRLWAPLRCASEPGAAVAGRIVCYARFFNCCCLPSSLSCLGRSLVWPEAPASCILALRCLETAPPELRGHRLLLGGCRKV